MSSITFIGTFIRDLLAGSLSGVIGYSFVYPLDFLKTMISLKLISEKKNIVSFISSNYLKNGLGSFYKGLGATLIVE